MDYLLARAEQWNEVDIETDYDLPPEDNRKEDLQLIKAMNESSDKLKF